MEKYGTPVSITPNVYDKFLFLDMSHCVTCLITRPGDILIIIVQGQTISGATDDIHKVTSSIIYIELNRKSDLIQNNMNKSNTVIK